MLLVVPRVWDSCPMCGILSAQCNSSSPAQYSWLFGTSKKLAKRCDKNHMSVMSVNWICLLALSYTLPQLPSKSAVAPSVRAATRITLHGSCSSHILMKSKCIRQRARFPEGALQHIFDDSWRSNGQSACGGFEAIRAGFSAKVAPYGLNRGSACQSAPSKP
jgi:hypothetical protein